MLFDIGGDDYYQLQQNQQGFGAATFRESYKTPNQFSLFDLYANSFGLLLDIGGTDTYMEWVEQTNKALSSKKYQNNSTWLSPSKDDENFGYNNYGVGMDVETGRVPELEIFSK
jgi:hypothetical protein